MENVTKLSTKQINNIVDLINSQVTVPDMYDVVYTGMIRYSKTIKY